MDDDGETVNVFPDSSIGGRNMLLSGDTRFWKGVYYKIAELLKNGVVAKTKVWQRWGQILGFTTDNGDKLLAQQWITKNALANILKKWFEQM
jgi:hypothetical protein